MNHTRTTGRGIIRCTATAILTLAAPFGLTACSLFESMDTGTPDTSASGAFEETNTTETSTIGTSSMEGGDDDSYADAQPEHIAPKRERPVFHRSR